MDYAIEILTRRLMELKAQVERIKVVEFECLHNFITDEPNKIKELEEAIKILQVNNLKN